MHFQDELQEKLYVIDCNLIRGQLNKFQKTELALKLKPILQKIAKRNSRANLKQNRKGSPSVLIGTVGTGNGDGIGIGRVDQEIGNRAGVGKNTVWRVEKLLGLESAHPELLAGLRSGKLSINKASNNVEKEERRQKIIDEAANYSFSKGDNSNEKCQLFRSDFRDLTPKKIVDNSIDLIFTDPPYEKKHLTIYDDLAKFAARTLVEGGSIVAYLRQYDIPTIFSLYGKCWINISVASRS
jgi:hypothetical protein